MCRPSGARRAESAAAKATALGLRGERIAARHLRRQGYRIVARRWRTAEGEIDLFAQHEGQWVLVEVKSGHATPSALAVRMDHKKRERLGRIARRLRATPRFRSAILRVDLVVVVFEGRRSRVIVRRNVSCGPKHR